MSDTGSPAPGRDELQRCYINPVTTVPQGIDVKVDKQTLISIRGHEYKASRRTGAANVDPLNLPLYKQKGIRYAGEVLRKEGQPNRLKCRRQLREYSKRKIEN